MKIYRIILFLFAFLTVQCSNTDRKPTYLENLISKKSQAEKVYITHNQVKTTTDGLLTNENYILVELYNPKILLDVKFNDRVFKNKCNELSDYILDSIRFQPKIDYDELRLKIIEIHGFSIFKTEEPTVLSYKSRN